MLVVEVVAVVCDNDWVELKQEHFSYLLYQLIDLHPMSFFTQIGRKIDISYHQCR